MYINLLINLLEGLFIVISVFMLVHTIHISGDVLGDLTLQHRRSPQINGHLLCWWSMTRNTEDVPRDVLGEFAESFYVLSIYSFH